MKITLIERCKAQVCAAIEKFGFSPEHNYYNYFYKQSEKKKAYFFDVGGSRGVIGILNQNTNVWNIVNGILAPKDEQIKVFLDFVNSCIRKKVAVESEISFKEQLSDDLLGSKYKMSLNYELYWPVVDLQNFDESLSGKEWKKIRNIRNRFESLQITQCDPRKLGKEQLMQLLLKWLKKRHPRDRVDYRYYQNIMEQNFDGFDLARAFLIGSELASVSAGWKVPNSETFYFSVGIFSYNYTDLGEFVNIEDIIYAKKLGYKKLDLGGSDKAILNFKKKFQPEKIYKTCIFSISGKKP